LKRAPNAVTCLWRKKKLLGDNTGDNAVQLRPISVHCVGGRTSAALLCLYTYTSSYVYSIPSYAKFDLRRTFRNVSTAEVRESLRPISGD